tara:strand:- start:69 stop:650 length:582 start_codon:yes stop_codon:yes gene_type:complete
MNKKKILKISFIIFIIIFSILVTYFKYIKKNEIVKNKNLEISEKNFVNSNIIKDIKYSSTDLQGNEYIILAEEGEIDLNNSDIIFLKNVNAFIKLFKNKETITISSNYGKYNTASYDTIFSKNVKIDYIKNKITSNYLDFSMANNLLIISKNVVYTNQENILKADVIKLNIITKDTKIFMHNSKDQVSVEGLN